MQNIFHITVRSKLGWNSCDPFPTQLYIGLNITTSNEHTSQCLIIDTWVDCVSLSQGVDFTGFDFFTKLAQLVHRAQIIMTVTYLEYVTISLLKSCFKTKTRLIQCKYISSSQYDITSIDL